MTSLNRRSVLRGAVGALGLGGLSGCLTGGRFRRYRVSNDAVPDALPAAVSADAVATPTNERPLVLEVSFESTASEAKTFSIEPPGAFPVGRITAGNEAPSTRRATTGSGVQRVVLAAVDAGTFEDACWMAAEADGASSEAAGSHSVRLDPGETVTAERAVLNHAANTACYPIGVYRFGVTFRSAPADAPDEDGAPVQWGFALEISDLRPD